MAEPARRLDDGEIYDKGGTEASNPRPELKALEGGGETSEPKSGHLEEVKSNNPSREQLAGAEENAATEEPRYENQVGSGYSASSKGSGTSKLRYMMIGTGRRKTASGAVISSIIAGMIIAVFFSLLPLKILHIVSNLQNRFYATSENAVQKETDHLFGQYIRSGLRSCQGTIHKDCNPIPVTTNPVTRMYKGWQNAKLEDKLKTKYGIEFGYSHSNYLMKAPGLSSAGLNINEFVNSINGESLDEFLAKSNSTDFTKVNRTQIRQAVRAALSTETRWKSVMYRF
jgi:hypothetical protein